MFQGSKISSAGWHWLQARRPDVMAGLTVALIAIPQAMAYAAIAGVNPVYGLYTAVIPAIIGALFGSSVFLVSGATNAVALATAGVLFLYAETDMYIEFVFALAIVSGIVMLLLGLLKLGSIIRYVSNSVLTGFLTGAGVLIIINQLGNLLGVSRPSGAKSYEVLIHLIQNVANWNLYVLAVGLLAIVIFVSIRRVNKKIPSAFLAIVITAVLVQLLGWDSHGIRLIQDMDPISHTSISFHLPNITLTNIPELFIGGGAVALLSLVETMSVAKALNIYTDKKLNPSRQFVAQGLASIASGFFQGIPSSGSPSRSAVNQSSGAQSRWAAGLSGVFVLIAMLAFSRWIGFIPLASLAGVVIVSAYNMINKHHLQLTWQSRFVSRLVLVVTFTSTLLLPLHLAIYLGAILSIGIYLLESSHMDIQYLIQRRRGEFEEHALADLLTEKPEVALVNVQGSLFFGAVDELEEQVKDIIDTGVKVLVLRVRGMHLTASTGITALENLLIYAKQHDTRLVLCGVDQALDGVLGTSGIRQQLGEEYIFNANGTLFSSTQKALQFAHKVC